jgi:hypothetical protein
MKDQTTRRLRPAGRTLSDVPYTRPTMDGTTTSSLRLALAALAAATALAGCGGRALAPSAGDALRSELAVRTKERDEARARAAELDAKMLALTAERNARIDPEVAEALPALATVSLSSLSTARLTAPTKAELAIVLVPSDGLGRFIQMTGTVRASVAALVPGRPPVPAGAVTLAPKALRGCYRSGFMGTHYTVEMPVEWDGAESARGLSVAGEFVDGVTGKTYAFLGTVPVVPAKSAAAAMDSSR